MKKLILAAAFFGFFGTLGVNKSQAANGQDVYETATSSIAVKAVVLSTSAPVLVSRTLAQSDRGDGKFITWYSISLFNVGAQFAYAFGPSATVAPAEATCALGVPVGAGTAAAPWHITEQFENMYMWAIACGSVSNTIIADYRGR